MTVEQGNPAAPAARAERCRREGMMSGMKIEMPEPNGGEETDFEAILDPRVQESIGRSLKAHYDDLINAPIPDKFLVLLAQLEAKESRSSAEEASDERP